MWLLVENAGLSVTSLPPQSKTDICCPQSKSLSLYHCLFLHHNKHLQTFKCSRSNSTAAQPTYLPQSKTRKTYPYEMWTYWSKTLIGMHDRLVKLNVTPLFQALGSVHGLIPGSSSKYLVSQLTSINLTAVSQRPCNFLVL